MKTSPNYRGMRWFKCDLHMHTPVDSKHWRGTPMSDNPDLAAQDFIRRCYELELEIIAITDHNFVSKGFIPRLRDAIEKLEHEFGYKIVLFPGFEINADVGKGMHVLAIFEPDTDLDEIDHILTECGIPMPRQNPDGTHQSSTKRLTDIINVVQQCDGDGYLKGVVVCPHPYETGIFDNDRISEWLQQHEWKNPELLAVEIPKPIHQLSEGWQRLFKNDDDCIPSWKRSRPMAAMMSSDAKALSKDEDQYNYIGKRFSWIKMSKPSIEALRQAFLDPESRICLKDDPPLVVHTYIKKIHVSASKFLQDQTVEFSPHLNCIIGGRGSGKSLLFESLRLGLRGEAHLENADKNHVAVKQLNRLRGTFTSKTKIELNVIHSGFEDRFVVDNSGQPARVENREVDDPPTVFHQLSPLIFSQEEITQLADRQESLLDFIDSLASDQLEPHRRKAREIIDHLKTARQIDEKLQRLESEFTTLKQEVSELSRQLEARTQVQEELKNHRAAQEAQRYLDSVTTRTDETISRLIELSKELEAEASTLSDQTKTFSESTFLIQIEKKINTAYHNLVKKLESAISDFHNEISLALEEPVVEKVRAAIKQAEDAFKKACDEKGLTPEEAEQLRETEAKHRIKQSDLQNIQSELEQVRKQMPDMKRLFRRLTICWARETKVRKNVLDDIVSSATMPRTNNGESIIKVSLIFAGDRESFLKAWEDLAPDRRTAAGRAWDRYARDSEGGNIGDQLFDAFQESIREGKCYGNPLHWLEFNWNNPDKLPRLVQQYLDDIKEIKEIKDEKSEKWFKLMITRIPDAADLTLLRSDGTVAGSFQKKDLSTGQKNTVILSLLLARGNGPVLIDQPEDELDSEFLFRELVPIFRKTKLQRQMIIVTHNANIPVNADAELVYAFKAEGGRGVCRAQGGLDRPETTLAVLDIMEGSEEAFRRRKDKYHF